MRKLAWFAGSFAAGVFALHYGVPWAAALCLLPVLLLKEGRPLRLGLIVAGTVLGLLWRPGYDALFRAPARACEGAIQVLTGAVADWPWATASGGAVTVRITSQPGPSFQAVYYGDESTLDLVPGDTVTLAAQWKSADSSQGRRTDSLTSRGVFLVGFGRGAPEWARPEQTPVSAWPSHALRWLQDQITERYPEELSPLLNALLTGDRFAMSTADYTALRRAGLAHAVAVSGMHLAFLAALVTTLLGKHRRHTVLIALPILWFFVFMTGAAPSVVRAAVMETFLLLAPLLGRESDSPTSLTAALMLLLLQNPYAAGSVSLQLSFAAVVGILCFSRRFLAWSRRYLPDGLPKWMDALLYGVLATLAVTIGALAFTIPLSAWYFGTVALVSPLASVLCLWAVELCFLFGLLSAFLPFLAWPVTALLYYFRWSFHRLAALPYATVNADSPYLLLALMFCYLLVLLYLLPKTPRRPLLPFCAGVMALAAALFFTHLDYHSGPATLTVLDVGQGQSVLLRSGDRLMAIDCGGSASNAGDIAADYLASRGRNKLDLLLLTHYDADHANGVAELLERVEVDVLLGPIPEAEDALAEEIFDLAREKGAAIRLIYGQNLLLPFGNGSLTVYAPLGAGEANEAGLSLLYEAGGFSALFTGDMDETVERRLVKYGGLPDVDFLVAGHHGARRSTSALLLDTVKPETVAISVGSNRYGHPHQETLARLEAAGCQVYRTDLQGNITLTLG